MRVAISGAGGLIGTAVRQRLEAEGASVVWLTRSGSAAPEGAQCIRWDPERRRIDADGLAGCDAVVHLAGENIASGRWSAARKRAIRDSRVLGAALLSETLAHLDRMPKTLVCASAVGYYGNRGDEELDETSSPGQGFLAEVCRDWEAAVAPAAAAGIRVVRLRIGMALSSRGGALARMAPLFRMGLGGPLGDGRAWISWISLYDLAELVAHCLRDAAATGPINAVSPHPVRNRDFARALGAALRRPAVLPAPAPAIRLLFGEMGRELLLSSARVLPRRLEALGFRFRHDDIEGALRACVNHET